MKNTNPKPLQTELINESEISLNKLRLLFGVFIR